jgi:hypothetical protein
MPILTSALFTTAKLSNEWIKKMWYIYTRESNSARKKNKMSFAGKWMDRETMLSKISQVTYHVSLICVESTPKMI